MAKKRREKNPVARVMNEFNKSTTQRDRKNDYKRKDKHVKRDSGPFSFISFTKIIDLLYVPL